MNHPSTVGELRESGYRPRTVKQEMRENLIAAAERENDSGHARFAEKLILHTETEEEVLLSDPWPNT